MKTDLRKEFMKVFYKHLLYNGLKNVQGVQKRNERVYIQLTRIQSNNLLLLRKESFGGVK